MDSKTSEEMNEIPKTEMSENQEGGLKLKGTGSLSKTNILGKSPGSLSSKDMFFRADKIDLKSLDVQLEKHLSRVWSRNVEPQGPKEVWEIDLFKLDIRYLIARGTYGTIYRGTYDNQDVAVKVLDWGEDGMATTAETASLRASFRQEVAVWHKLDHPNVTKFVGASMGTSDLKIPSNSSSTSSDGLTNLPARACCVVVEFLPGGTLKTFLYKNRKKKLAFKIVVQLALDLARGLSYLHSKKIVHRDVKAENMLLDLQRNLKIADFGVARVEAQNPKDMTGETGTLGYMAPEVLDGKPYNRKCDVYSFGICLWEIYCCDLPYTNLSFAEVSSAVVRQVHLDYLEAGANIIISASYQATLQGFEAKGMSREEGEALLRRSVEIAREARDIHYDRATKGSWDVMGNGNVPEQNPILVAASVGSYGAYLADGSEYSGIYGDAVTLETLKDFHRRRVQILAESGADLIAFETTPNKLEAKAYAELLEEEEIKIPAWFSFNSKDGINVVSGDSISDCASIADSCKQVVAVGINCTPPRFIHGLIQSIEKVTSKPIVIYPNSGETYDGVRKEWVASTGVADEDFVSYVGKWREAGASLIGGCCRTTPNTIRAIYKTLSKQSA